MQTIVFIHGMFQNPRSWDKWVNYFDRKHYDCVAPAWPLHEGEPLELRTNPPPGLGDLRLEQVIAHMEDIIGQHDDVIAIGHSVGGLVTQILLNRGVVSRGVAISSVAPNGMLDFDWGFIKNGAIITNPLKGNDPVYMDAKTFHAAFANTLDEQEAAMAFARFATHDSRNVLRDCMGAAGHVDFEVARGPLLLISGEEDRITPPHLNEKNYKAYKDSGAVTDFKIFAGRSHYICGEPGWEEVAGYVAEWLEQPELGLRPLEAPRPGQDRYFRV